MKTQIIRLAWQYGLKVIIKDQEKIIIKHLNGKEMEVIGKDNQLILKTTGEEEINSIQAFEKKIKFFFQLQEKNRFITLSDKQINDDLLCSSFTNIVLPAVDPVNLNCVTLIIEESFDYLKYKQLKNTVLEQKASAQIKHTSKNTEIIIVGEKEIINHIIQKENLPDDNILWNKLKAPIVLGASIMDEEEYLSEKTTKIKELTNKLTNEINHLEELHQRQLNSISWKVTKPLRILTGIAKKVIRR